MRSGSSRHYTDWTATDRHRGPPAAGHEQKPSGPRPQGHRGARHGDNGVGHYNSPARSVAGHKRKLDALRNSNTIEVTRAGPPTAPSVPSFGSPLFNSSVRAPLHAAVPRKQSLFGLNRSSQGDAEGYNSDPANASGDDDDDQDLPDEEAEYAELGTKLVFEYEGTYVKLDSEAALKAWHEERKRRWPSNARVAAVQAQRRDIGEERKRLLEGAYALRQPGFNFRSRPTFAEQEALTAETAASVQAPSRIETSQPQPNSTSLLGLAAYDSGDSDNDPDAQPAVSDVVESNEHDLNDGPELASSKAFAEHERGQPACKYFFHNGKCREGANCAYRHEPRSDQSFEHIPAAQRRQRLAKSYKKQQTNGRKGIHELLVDQEGEAANRLALQVIKYLGGVGFFKQK